MMFFSASCNVARRYGHHVVATELHTEFLPVMSVEDWLSGSNIPDGTFIIEGESDSFDFPVDTLVLREAPESPLAPLTKEQIRALDDGRAYREPTSRSDRDWRLFVDNIYCGDVARWERDNQPGPWI